MLKPYSNIESQNLALFLLVARITAIIGIVLVGLSVLFLLFNLVETGFSIFSGLASGLTFIPMSIGLLAGSGIMAAIVSFEENHRRSTEAIISANKN